MTTYPVSVFVAYADKHGLYSRTYLLLGPTGATSNGKLQGKAPSIAAVRSRQAEFERDNPGGLTFDYSHRLFAHGRKGAA